MRVYNNDQFYCTNPLFLLLATLTVARECRNIARDGSVVVERDKLRESDILYGIVDKYINSQHEETLYGVTAKVCFRVYVITSCITLLAQAIIHRCNEYSKKQHSSLSTLFNDNSVDVFGVLQDFGGLSLYGQKCFELRGECSNFNEVQRVQ